MTSIPRRLLAIPEVAAAAATVDRAGAAAVRADRAFAALSSRGVPAALAPFDEASAGARVAKARAGDAVYDTDAAERVQAEIDRERIEHAQQVTVSEAAAAEAGAKLASARQAHEAANNLLHETRNALQVQLRAHADELLPQLLREAIDQAAALFDLSVEIREIAKAGDPGLNASHPLLELVLQGGELPHELVGKAGARVGGSHSTRGIVFDEQSVPVRAVTR